jgi:hypothetical protein
MTEALLGRTSPFASHRTPSNSHFEPSQVAEKLSFDLLCNKGTTLVGPQMQQNKGWALALLHFFTTFDNVLAFFRSV